MMKEFAMWDTFAGLIDFSKLPRDWWVKNVFKNPMCPKSRVHNWYTMKGAGGVPLTVFEGDEDGDDQNPNFAWKENGLESAWSWSPEAAKDWIKFFWSLAPKILVDVVPSLERIESAIDKDTIRKGRYDFGSMLPVPMRWREACEDFYWCTDSHWSYETNSMIYFTQRLIGQIRIAREAGLEWRVAPKKAHYWWQTGYKVAVLDHTELDAYCDDGESTGGGVGGHSVTAGQPSGSFGAGQSFSPGLRDCDVMTNSVEEEVTDSTYEDLEDGGNIRFSDDPTIGGHYTPANKDSIRERSTAYRSVPSVADYRSFDQDEFDRHAYLFDIPFDTLTATLHYGALGAWRNIRDSANQLGTTFKNENFNAVFAAAQEQEGLGRCGRYHQGVPSALRVSTSSRQPGADRRGLGFVGEIGETPWTMQIWRILVETTQLL